MATRIVLHNLLVQNSSSRAGKPKGTQFVLGKGLKVALQTSEAEKLLDIKNQAITKASQAEGVPVGRITANEIVKYNTATKSDFMYLNLTRVPQEKGTETYLTNEDGTYVEEICNFLPNEDGKFERRMPTIIFNGEKTDVLPFAGSLVDVVLLLRVSYDKDKLAIKIFVDVEEVVVVKPAEGQTGGSAKTKNVVDIELDIEEPEEVEAKPAKKATKKTSKADEETEVSTDTAEDLF